MPIIIEQTLEIDAPLETAWSVLTELDRYGEWNPFVVRCRSTLRPGAPISMRVKVLPFFAQPQRETVFDHVPRRRLSYGISLPTGMLNSYRSHEFETLPGNRTLYRSKFRLQGWLSPLVALLVKPNLQRGFGAMSAALQRRAEAIAPNRAAA